MDCHNGHSKVQVLAFQHLTVYYRWIDRWMDIFSDLDLFPSFRTHHAICPEGNDGK